MTIFPNAKINIGLSILGRREDGFHDIETILYPVGLRDALEFVTADNDSDSDELTVTGIDTGCRMPDNLVIKSLNILRKEFSIPALMVHLHKVIPTGAGLGGGSSDAAFMVKYLNRYFRLGMCNNDLRLKALEAGSDCPFFIDNMPVLAAGRGELMTPVKNLLSGYNIVIVNPGIHINTGEAYRSVVPAVSGINLADLFRQPVDKWKGTIINAFEKRVFENYPVIRSIKERLYEMGAVYSSMSGSGSSVYGIFRKEVPDDELLSRYWTWQGKLG